jgi:hypothetical protein
VALGGQRGGGTVQRAGSLVPVADATGDREDGSVSREGLDRSTGRGQRLPETVQAGQLEVGRGKAARASPLAVAPTVIASGTLAGVKTQEGPAELPPAATNVTPAATALVTAVSMTVRPTPRRAAATR